MQRLYFWVLDTIYGTFKRRIQELESQKFDLEHALFEAQQFARIADEKLTTWVSRHDDLLIKHKELVAKLPAELRSQLGYD